MTEEIRVILTVADRHMIGIKAGNDKENVSTVEVRMLEGTVQRMEKKCRKCGRNNHFQKVCISRENRVQMLEEESVSETEGESFSDEFLAYGVKNKGNKTC